MQRSSSFCKNEKQPPPSRIPAPLSTPRPSNGVPERPTSLLRRSTSLRLPSSRSLLASPVEKEVWGIGSGSWGKRQQMRKQQSFLDKLKSPKSPMSPRGLGVGSLSCVDKLGSYYRGGNSSIADDDDDVCSERSYDSTMSVDRASSRRYVVHCSSDLSSATSGAAYLTPTQRTALLNKELKARLHQAMDDIISRDHEISRLTQECVELRMNHVRVMRSTSPQVRERSQVTCLERDSLNCSMHSKPSGDVEPMFSKVPIISDTLDEIERLCEKEEEQQVVLCDVPPRLSFESVINLEQDEEHCLTEVRVEIPLSLADSGNCESLVSQELSDILQSEEKTDQLVLKQEASTQTLAPTPEVLGLQEQQTLAPTPEVLGLQEQLAAAKEALIETKVQLSRVKSVVGTSHSDVTLQFLKSAFFHLVTDSGQGTPAATKSHWKAIQSILGFTAEESKAMDSAIVAGTFPGGSW